MYASDVSEDEDPSQYIEDLSSANQKISLAVNFEGARKNTQSKTEANKLIRKLREDKLDQTERDELAIKRKIALKNRSPEQIQHAIKVRQHHQLEKSVVQKAKESQSKLIHQSKVRSNRPWIQHKTVAQFWDYEHPCIHCGAEWLKSVTKKGRLKCCQGGRVFLDTSNFPHLQPLPDRLKCLLLNRTQHMSPNSAIYNNMFSFARVSVDNHRGNKFEEIRGSSGVKINGRVYSYLPRAYDTPTMSG
jgi:hypothetical protein